MCAGSELLEVGDGADSWARGVSGREGERGRLTGRALGRPGPREGKKRPYGLKRKRERKRFRVVI